jgi:hypothetical protein
MSREDPKPGRWILPLVVAGIVGFTYAFVNAIPPGQVSDSTIDNGTETTLPADTSVPPTTTLPPEVVAFVADVQSLVNANTDLIDRAQQINDDWDTGEATFSDTRDSFETLLADIGSFGDDVAAIVPPEAAADAWQDALLASEDMVIAADQMLDGFLEPESSTGRRNGHTALQAAATACEDALNQARAALNE